jgi:hypothetical protein
VTAVARPADLVFAGSGPAGSASAPDARKQSVEVVPDDAAGPVASAVRVAAPALRTPGAASGASQALAARTGVPRLTAPCWLVPSLRPVRRSRSPMPHADLRTWFITRPAIRRPGHARSPVQATSLEPAAGGLLAQLLGAIGSLL